MQGKTVSAETGVTCVKQRAAVAAVAFIIIMIDCHAHMYPPQFSPEDLTKLIAEAQAAGVTAIVTVPESFEDCQQVLELCKRLPLLRACAGLHPVQPLHIETPYSDQR